MKLDNYELVISFAMPCYLYIEGESKEKFYVDEQTCDYYLFNDKDAEQKFWKIMLYKPNNIKHVDKNNIHLCKWLVNESYHDFVYDDSDDDTDYEYYEWDFKNHCVKKVNMKYRILKEEKGFRAQVQLESKRFGKYFEYIEEDGNLNSCPITHYYETEQEAIEACKKHHVKMGYDKLPKVVDEFEL